MTARTDLRAVYVVVPAHDEQDHIGSCLTSVRRAAATLQRARPGLYAGTVLVLDRCADGTGAIGVTQHADCVEVDAGSVGIARRAGVRRVLDRVERADRAGGGVVEGVLVVNTDADCVVPPSWLVEHVELAADHDLVLGEVEPDPTEMSAPALAAWWSQNPRGRGSLHGANLSFRLDAYLRAGGFPEIAEQEDLLLVRAMRAAGAAVVGGTRVMTSARREGRVPGGFSGYLRQLDLDLAALDGS